MTQIEGVDSKESIPAQAPGEVHEDHSSIITGAQLDIATWYEAMKVLPPAMFSTLSGLEEWATECGYSSKPLGMNNSFRFIESKGPPNKQRSYSQLWVKASYGAYRKGFATLHSERDKIEIKKLSLLHADHVINKGRLTQNYPEAWVMLFPVQAGANSGFGWQVEMKLPSVVAGKDSLNLEPLTAFKIFCGDMPKTKEELKKVLDKRVKGMILGKTGSDLCDEMEKAVAPYLS